MVTGRGGSRARVCIPMNWTHNTAPLQSKQNYLQQATDIKVEHYLKKFIEINFNYNCSMNHS